MSFTKPRLFVRLAFCVVFGLNVLIPVAANAEEAVEDSLRSVWNNKNLHDTVRHAAYVILIQEHVVFNDPDLAFDLANELMQSADRASDYTALAQSHNLLGTAHFVKGNYEKALDEFILMKEVYKASGNKSGEADALGNVGVVYNNLGDNVMAMKYFLDSYDRQLELGDKRGMSVSLSNIGLIYHDKGDYPRALGYYAKALAYEEELDNKPGMAGSYINIGNMYLKINEYDKAIAQFEKGITICDQIDMDFFKTKGFNGLATTYRRTGDFDRAISYAQKALDLADSLGEIKTIVSVLGNIGDNYYSLGQIDTAQSYYLKALELSKELGNKRKILDAKITVGETYVQLGQFGEAETLCLEGYRGGEELQATVISLRACRCLYKVHKAQGSYKEAMEFHEKILAYSNTIENDKTAQKLQQIEFSRVMYQDSIQKEKERLELQLGYQKIISEESRNRNIAIGIGIILLVLAGGLYNRYRFVRRSREAVKLERDRAEDLLLNILPFEIAEELKEKGYADAQDFEMVSILFTDFVDFTKASAKLSASELVQEVNECFKSFDHIIEKYGIEKIKTIGDAYMAAGGLPVPGEDSVKNTVLAALEMQEFIEERRKTKDERGEMSFQMRVGIHTGPVVAGIVGVKKFQYDIWGDTVNTASRIESHGEAGKVNISQATYELLTGTSTPDLSKVEGGLRDRSQFLFESRGKIEAKGKGTLDMYFVTRKEGPDDHPP